MKNLLKQPLVHFLLTGLGFFILYGLVSDTSYDSRVIVVDKGSLMTYIQYQAKGFNAEIFERKLAEMPAKELKQLIDNYVKEEVLYREAKAMGLDQEDNIIKRRMIQKVEFISQGIAEATTEVSEEEVEQYYEDNKEDYFIEPFVTFTHVFFDFEKWTEKEAETRAKAEVAFLNRNSIRFDQAPGRGDRFFYHINYVERDPGYVAGHFGSLMAEAIFSAEPSDKTWIGPLLSEYGYHLVMVTRKTSGRYLGLEEVRARVMEDVQREMVRQENEEMILEIIDGYDVRVTLDGLTVDE